MQASSRPPADGGVLPPLPWKSAVYLLAVPSSLASLVSEPARQARVIGAASPPLGGLSVTGPGGSVTREESLSLRNRRWYRYRNWIRPDENPTSSLAVSRIVCAVGLLSWLERVPHGEGKRTRNEQQSAELPCHRDTFPRGEYETTGSAPEARPPQQPSRCANTHSLIYQTKGKLSSKSG
jgi:hypothetical protein